jgi:hypothetical protein
MVEIELVQLYKSRDRESLAIFPIICTKRNVRELYFKNRNNERDGQQSIFSHELVDGGRHA